MDVLLRIDQSVLLWINSFAHHSFAFDKAAVAIASRDFLNGGFLFIFLWWMWFRESRDPARDRIDTMRMFTSVWFTVVIARILQISLPHRLRPIHDAAVGFTVPLGGDATVLEHWSSFPSDHAAVFFALATAIWMRYRWLGAIAYVWVFVFGCLARVYAGYHYPSDIVVGAAIGIAVMRIAEGLPWPTPASRLTNWIFFSERRYTAAFYCAAVALTYLSITLFDDVRAIGRGIVQAVVG